MKVTIFSKPLEYSFFTDGEKWRQGEKIKATLKIKNHSVEKIELPILKISLAIGNIKKIKSRDQKAWEYLDHKTLAENFSIGSSEEKEFFFDFQLAEDCQITEKDKSLHLTFLDKIDTWPTGLLELVVEPKLVMMQFLEIFQHFMRFKIGPSKFSKGMVEVKLTPPNSKELSHVESLILRMKEVNQSLDLEYIFTTHAFEMVAGNMVAQKKSSQINETLTSKQYYIYGDSPNHEFIQSSIGAAISKGTPRFILS